MRREISQEDYEKIRLEAVRHFGEDAAIVQCAWEQVFSNTTCGFGGIGGQAITSAPVFVFAYRSEALVYIGSRLAYAVRSNHLEEKEALAMDILHGNITEPSRYAGGYGERLARSEAGQCVNP